MANIAHIWQKIKSGADQVLLAAVIVLMGALGFGLGRLSKIEEAREPVRIESAPAAAAVAEAPVSAANDGQFVASKNGTKYHALWCPGAKQISEKNKIYFNSKEAAEQAGYSPAANCKGI